MSEDDIIEIVRDIHGKMLDPTVRAIRHRLRRRGVSNTTLWEKLEAGVKRGALKRVGYSAVAGEVIYRPVGDAA